MVHPELVVQQDSALTYEQKNHGVKSSVFIKFDTLVGNTRSDLFLPL